MSNQTIAQNTLFVNESPLVFWEGSVHNFNFNFLGTGTIDSATVAWYRGKSVDNTKLSTTTGTVTGRVVTTGYATMDTPGDHVIYVTIVYGTNSRRVGLKIFVTKLGSF